MEKGALFMSRKGSFVGTGFVHYLAGLDGRDDAGYGYPLGAGDTFIRT